MSWLTCLLISCLRSPSPQASVSRPYPTFKYHTARKLGLTEAGDNYSFRQRLAIERKRDGRTAESLASRMANASKYCGVPVGTTSLGPCDLHACNRWRGIMGGPRLSIGHRAKACISAKPIRVCHENDITRLTEHVKSVSLYPADEALRRNSRSNHRVGFGVCIGNNDPGERQPEEQGPSVAANSYPGQRPRNLASP